MHGELIDEALGQGRIEPQEPVVSGTKATWRIIYTAGQGGILPGGRVRITIPHGFSCPQSKAFFEPGFVTVDAENADLLVSIKIVLDIFCRLDKSKGHSGAWGRNVFLTIGEPGLQEGESITLVYGNADYYGGEPFSYAGARARELSGPAEFIIAVDPDGKRSAPFSGYTRIASSPVLVVLPAEVSRISAIAPSDAIRNEQILVKEVYIDHFNNPVRVEQAPIQVSSVSDTTRGSMRVGNLEARTNPIRLNDQLPGLKLFWGDIHGHTMHSDGLGTIHDYYGFAAEVAALDFAAITDHDDIGPRLLDDEWTLMKEAAQKYYQPGKFVTFLGHEYRNGQTDMNVYYPAGDGDLLRGTDGNLGDAAEFTRQVKNRGGMIVPHMHFGADWSGMDPEVYRVMEVYSSHGCAEYKNCPREIPYLQKQVQKSSKTNKDSYVHDALKLGYRLGLTAGSDTHSGRPGFSDWTRVTRTYLGGLTALFATELTREAIWDALYNRRCYATTGNRSILEFSINGAMMGSEIGLKAGMPRNISVKCHADGNLKALRIFRSGEIFIHDEELSGDRMKQTFVENERTTDDWYYVRVDLDDGEMVWSSPIWVANESPAE
ncbi:MAG: CehA/McbA family metallohydrolase [Candidatus Hodarchaeota archaeon]